MIVGDLVKLRAECSPRNGREVGAIIQFSASFTIRYEVFAEVLWNTGKLGWILAERVEVISDS